jgi:hypothetical protein
MRTKNDVSRPVPYYFDPHHFSDQRCNVITDPSQPVPRRADDLNDTMGNDLIMGEWGDDNIRTIREW